MNYDQKLIAEACPDLKYRIDEENELVVLEGFITLRAECGVKTKIEIRLDFPRLYPEQEPAVYEVGIRFPHIADRHFFKDGRCCLWLPPETLWRADDPNALLSFLHQVSIFFDKQLICDALGGNSFPGEARSHGIFGYIEFVEEQLGGNRELLIKLKPVFTKPSSVGRNQRCPCDSGQKFKRCHSDEANNIIRRVGATKIREIFQKWTPDVASPANDPVKE